MKTRALSLIMLAGAVLAFVPGWAMAEGLFHAEAVSGEELAAERGMADTFYLQLSRVSEQATMTGNSIGQATTGYNSVAEGAFANANGMTSLIQNTGNHVIIQESLILNVTVQP